MKKEEIVLNILEKLINPEKFNKLNILHELVSELNYHQNNNIISRRQLTDTVIQVIEDEPLILASEGVNKDFHIIYTRLKSNELSKDDERLVVNHLIQEYPYALFIFSNQPQSHWHFVNVKYDDSPERKRLIRRITVGEGEKLRTAIERISLLDLESITDKSVLGIQARHDEAFDVEAVTKEFFTEYDKIFKEVKKDIKGISDEDKKHLFTQKLFNRLLFIAFIQKKGWLKLNGQTDYNYLSALWNNYQKDNSKNKKTFYEDRLSYLFFQGLNQAEKTEETRKKIGDVPYLNGGLFESDKDDKDTQIQIPNECIQKNLDKLFKPFNFTVTESTPLDVEVAVDPEMLGKVFEELVTGRHEKGSYFTPKGIVSFMCKEGLKGYFGRKYERLIDEHNASDITVPEARELLGKLDSLKVVDPACGSGAYLLGMLHELHAITRLLDTRAEKDTSRDDYHRKLSIIQNNLYGVDKYDFAVNIARLRLWLSLAVEFDGYPPEPLPNLDFKIMGGDSLTAIIPETVIKDELIIQYQEAKAKYMHLGKEDDKENLKKEIKNLEKQITQKIHNKDIQKGFDWVVKFAEVFAQGGFDIVLANPPYGASVGDDVRNLYFDKKKEGSQSKDTYGLFIARGLQLLCAGGHLCYIVSDTWRTIKSHKPLRKRLLETTTISHFIDLPSWIFKATVNTCILTATKSKASQDHKLIAADLRNLKEEDWKSLSHNLTAIATHNVEDSQTIYFARYTYPQSLISTYDKLSFFIGSPKLYKMMSDKQFDKLEDIATVKSGLTTGNDKYYLRQREGIRGRSEILDETKLLNKDEISKLTDEEKLNGVDPQNYGGRHFLPFDNGGESKTDEGWLPNYYVPTQYFIDWSIRSICRMRTATIADIKRRKKEIDKIKLDDNKKLAAAISNSEYYFRQGITFSRTGQYAPTYRLNSGTLFGSEGSSIFSDKFSAAIILGFLSSKLARYFIKSFLNNTVHAQVGDIKEFIITSVNIEIIQQIESLVLEIIRQQKIDPKYSYHLHEQKEIDKLIYELYGLSEEDIQEIELWYCRRYPKLAKAQG